MQRLMLAFLPLLLRSTSSFWGKPRFWQMAAHLAKYGLHKIFRLLSEIGPGGPPKDGIPSIDAPNFVPVTSQTISSMKTRSSASSSTEKRELIPYKS